MKTIAVKVDHVWKNFKVGKSFTRSKKFLAHDEHEVARVGDFVEVKISRKLSRHKAWTLHKILKRENYMSDEKDAPCPEVIPFPRLPVRKSRRRKVARGQKVLLKLQRQERRKMEQDQRGLEVMDKIRLQTQEENSVTKS